MPAVVSADDIASVTGYLTVRQMVLAGSVVNLFASLLVAVFCYFFIC